LANENRETVRTYELNLLVTGGWLSIPIRSRYQSPCLWLGSVEKSTDDRH